MPRAIPCAGQSLCHQYSADRRAIAANHAQRPAIAIGIAVPAFQREWPGIKEVLEPRRRPRAQHPFGGAARPVRFGRIDIGYPVFVAPEPEVSPSTTQLTPPPLWQKPKRADSWSDPEAGALADVDHGPARSRGGSARHCGAYQPIISPRTTA